MDRKFEIRGDAIQGGEATDKSLEDKDKKVKNKENKKETEE